jgi:hypothetical protein
MSATVWRARKTVPCQNNHFSRSRLLPIVVIRLVAVSADSSRSGSGGGGRRDLVMLVITVILIVIWNQSSRCSESGLR